MSARVPRRCLASAAVCTAVALAACTGPQPRAPIRSTPVAVTELPEPVPPVASGLELPLATPAADSPWQRLRKRFLLAGCDYSDEVVKQAHRLTASPGRFSSSWRQAMPLLEIVIAEIERRGLPGEFALLPYVESRYRILPGKTGSPAGMWQLMAPTARAHGVHVSATYDGRLDPFDSTGAALDLIEHFDREFGDWRLASMAYNAGEYRVKRALRGRTASGMTAESLAKLDVSPVTHQFLDRILALACIVKDPDRFQVDLPQGIADETLEAITLDSPVDFVLAARLAGLTIEELGRYNAGWLGRNFATDIPPRLVLPKRATDTFISALSRIPEKNRAHWKALRIDRATSLQLLADALEVPVEALAIANGYDRHVDLHVGQRLLVPGCDTPSCKAAETETHEIRSGDTLSAIARRYGVRVAELMQWNSLRRETILRTGMHLRIRAPGY